jgi:membrane fusion protein, multidrug efflux system
MDQPVKSRPETSRAHTVKVPQGKLRFFKWLTLLVFAVIAATFWWTRERGQPPQPGNGRNAPVISIVPEVVEKGDIGVSLNALGTVTSLATVTVRTQISGYLMKVNFKEGDEVKKGDSLAEIDPRPYEAALALAKGNLARDEALLKGARVDLTRYQGLAAQNAVAHQTLDTQIALVAQYEGTVQADHAAVQAAEVNLQFCHIVSPLDGRVGLRQVDQGNYVTPGDANGLVVITQLYPISVLFTVPEDNLQRIARRLAVGATLPAMAYDRGAANKIADGVLQTFDSQIDPTTGTIKLRAQFSNDEKRLFPNQFVNIRLLVDTHKNVTVMPVAGIQRGVPGTFVYLVNANSTVSVRKVELGATDGDRIEVRSGLSPGDRIVVDGADKLRDGAKINLRTASNSEPSGQPNSANGKSHSGNGQKQ